MQPVLSLMKWEGKYVCQRRKCYFTWAAIGGTTSLEVGRNQKYFLFFSGPQSGVLGRTHFQFAARFSREYKCYQKWVRSLKGGKSDRLVALLVRRRDYVFTLVAFSINFARCRFCFCWLFSAASLLARRSWFYTAETDSTKTFVWPWFFVQLASTT